MFFFRKHLGEGNSVEKFLSAFKPFYRSTGTPASQKNQSKVKI